MAEEKIIALGLRVKPLKIDNMDEDELRKKAAELWEQIIQLESDKYDLEERRKRQDYDVSSWSADWQLELTMLMICCNYLY